MLKPVCVCNGSMRLILSTLVIAHMRTDRLHINCRTYQIIRVHH